MASYYGKRRDRVGSDGSSTLNRRDQGNVLNGENLFIESVSNGSGK
jgi:hypothetical protein